MIPWTMMKKTRCALQSFLPQRKM
ncbi:hypothetical protein LINGRAHAP2_LOCUS7412 [Linum grandiflorum]